MGVRLSTDIGARLTVLAAVLAASLAVLVPTAVPASRASVGWVYISAPTWLGNCPRGGSVRYLNVSNWGPSVISYAADFGDDLVYLKVALSENNALVVAPVCYSGTRSWPGAGSTHTIRPTRAGQTWWLGPFGARRN
jgi:hypothetical protein